MCVYVCVCLCVCVRVCACVRVLFDEIVTESTLLSNMSANEKSYHDKSSFRHFPIFSLTCFITYNERILTSHKTSSVNDKK